VGNDRRCILNSVIVSTPGSWESILTVQAAAPLSNDHNAALEPMGNLESSTSAYKHWEFGSVLFMTAGDRETETGAFSRARLGDRSL